MTREEKTKEIDSLVNEFSAYSNFYVTDVASLDSEKTSKLRRLCHSKNVKMRVAKNTLIQKALEKIDANAYEGIFASLKGTSAIMFSEVSNTPAKLIKEFRKTSEKPILKGAWIDSSIFIGDKELTTLSNLKSKNELIGEIIGLLQSPAKNVISQLQSSGQKLTGILKTLENKGA
jgi:large subunit ribosomal protein L10